MYKPNNGARQAAFNRIRDKVRPSGSAPADNHVRQALAQISSNMNVRSKEEDFEKLSKLGEGSFGIVYQV